MRSPDAKHVNVVFKQKKPYACLNAETGKPYDLKDPEMLQQDLDPEKDQDRAAGKLGF